MSKKSKKHSTFDCSCGRKVVLDYSGRIPRHKDMITGTLCLNSGKPVSLMGKGAIHEA